MRLPFLNSLPAARDLVDQFMGYNHNLRIADGEMYDEMNMSSDDYPVLSTRKKRAPTCTDVTKASGITSADFLYIVNNKNNNNIALYKYSSDGIVITQVLQLDNAYPHFIPRQLVRFGAYIVVFPDGKYVNTEDTDDKGDINNTYSAGGSETVTFTLCEMDGTPYENVYVGENEPPSPTDGLIWLDTANNVLKIWSSAYSEWIAEETVYIQISAPGIAAGYSAGDGATITGIESDAMPDIKGKTSVLQTVYRDKDNDGAGDYIVVIGMIEGAAAITEVNSNLLIERQAPIMDFVVEANNRLWGCRKGKNRAGEEVNEIYASKLGDFKNWSVFNGISTDSYVASVGSYGPFTGAITYLSNPIFFKENCLHKIYGNQPSNFQINTAACRGVAEGAAQSLAIVGERVLYKTTDGVCSYDGSLPYVISSQFGDVVYSGADERLSHTNYEAVYNPFSGAVGGSDGRKYYLSCKSETDGNWYLLTYDTQLGLWRKEDETRVRGFAYYKNTMYFIENSQGQAPADDNRTIKKYAESGEEIVKWQIVSGDLGVTLPDKQYISKITIKMALVVGSLANIYIQYDGIGQWQHVSTIHGYGLKAFTVPIRPRRCSFFKIKIEGEGQAKLYSISKSIRQGSDKS